MKKGLLLILFGAFISTASFSQDCFTRLQKAFDERGATAVANDMHRNVILSFLEDGSYYCLSGKVRVEQGFITNIFIQFEDGEYERLEKKFTNAEKKEPAISNGISEMIYIDGGERLRVVFIDNLKPKKKGYKPATLPDDI